MWFKIKYLNVFKKSYLKKYFYYVYLKKVKKDFFKTNTYIVRKDLKTHRCLFLETKTYTHPNVFVSGLKREKSSSVILKHFPLSLLYLDIHKHTLKKFSLKKVSKNSPLFLFPQNKKKILPSCL